MSSSLISYFPIFVHLLSTLSLWISYSVWSLPRQAFVSSVLLLLKSSLENHLLLKMPLNPVTRSQLLSSCDIWLRRFWLLKILCLRVCFVVAVVFHVIHIYSPGFFCYTCLSLVSVILALRGCRSLWLSLSSSIAWLNTYCSWKDFLVTAPTILLGPHTHALHHLLPIKEI